jgi:enoyl-CoA hydratase/carnithine racemase
MTCVRCCPYTSAWIDAERAVALGLAAAAFPDNELLDVRAEALVAARRRTSRPSAPSARSAPLTSRVCDQPPAEPS